MSEQAIISLAILKVNWDQGHDYIENFVPFVAECIRTAPQAEVSLSDLQADIASTFGLRIPQGALSTILKRVVKRGFAKATEGIYRRDEKALAALDFAGTRATVLREHQALIAKLVEFCDARYQIKWSDEQSEAALLTYLKGRSMPILAAAVDGEPISTPAQPPENAEFLVNAFIAHLCDNDPEGFEFLETIVKGSMLASVLFFPEVGQASRRFDRVKVFLDTSFLLRALGLAPPAAQTPRRELMGLLYDLNGELRCFEHTVNEIERILGRAARALRTPGIARATYGEALEYFINLDYQASDVELMIARLRQSLRNLRVQVEPKPRYETWLGVDEVELESILREEVKYQREGTLRHDLDSLTAIHRLRHGEFPEQIESCDAVFVTTNTSLVRASARFFAIEYGKDAIAVPHCLLDHLLTTIVWLKQPMSVPDLPRKTIIADCYAALNPPNTLWRVYLREARRLAKQGEISEEDYDLLRFSTEARTLLMDSTKGHPEACAEGTVREILEKARAAARAETEEALRAEKQKREQAERRLAEGLERIRSIGTTVGWWASTALTLILTAVVVAGICAALFAPFPDLIGGRCTWIVLLVAVSFAVLSGANMIFGITLKSLKRGVEIRISHVVEQTLRRISMP